MFLTCFRTCFLPGRAKDLPAALYLSIRRVKKKKIVLIIGAYQFCQLYNFIQHLAVKVKILSNILLPRLTPYVEEIIGDHQCEFWCNWSTTDHIFCIHKVLKKKWEYNESVQRLCIALKKAYNSVRREVMCSILTEFDFHMKLVRLYYPYCPNVTCSRIQVGKHLSDMFLIKKCLKYRFALSPLLFNFALGYAIERLRYTRMAWY